MRNLLERIYSYIRQFFLRRETIFSSSEMPIQEGNYREQRYVRPEYRTADRPDYPQQDYPQREQRYQYPQQAYPPQDYPQRGGMNPWLAGGLGAIGGGLAGYGLGQAVGEMQQQLSDRDENMGNEGMSEMGFDGGDFGGMDFGGE